MIVDLLRSSALAYNSGDYRAASNLLWKACERTTRSDVDYSKVRILRAQAELKLGRGEFALRLLEQVKDIDKDCPYWIVKADVYNTLKWPEKSVEAINTALNTVPVKKDAYKLAGVIYHQSKLYDLAETNTRRYLDLDQFDHEALANLGNTLYALRRVDDARKALLKSITIKPEFADGWCNLGSLEMKENNVDKAIYCYKKALLHDRHSAIAHHALGIICLMAGDYPRGFALNEYRWRAVDIERIYPWPLWTGLPGRVFILAEQGFGDCLMMFRYLPILREMGIDFTLLTHISFHRFLRKNYSWLKLSDGSHKPSEFDYYCHTMSLPHILKTKLETIPPTPYLNCFKAFTSIAKIGFCYRGNPQQEQDFQRSIPFEQFKEIFDWIPDWRKMTVNLAHGDDIQFSDWQETAQYLKSIDLLITVDTGLAHLAGALGIQAWVLLPRPTYWPYGDPDSGTGDEISSPWYPSLRLFRQPRPYDWKSVIAVVRNELRKRMNHVT